MTAPGPPTQPFYAIANSRCMPHFFSNATPVCNKRIMLDPIQIHTPSGTILHSTHEANLDLPRLPLATCHGHIIPQLATQPLLSIRQLCNAGCNVAFTADCVTIQHNDMLILQGHQTPTSKLWELNIQPPTPAMYLTNAAIGSASPAELLHLHMWHFSAQSYLHLLKHCARVTSLNFPA